MSREDELREELTKYERAIVLSRMQRDKLVESGASDAELQDFDENVKKLKRERDWIQEEYDNL